MIAKTALPSRCTYAMIASDTFVIIVPVDCGLPFLVTPGDDLSAYLDIPFVRLNKTVALRDGKSVQGSVFRGRKTTAGDELHIHELLNSLFNT